MTAKRAAASSRAEDQGVARGHESWIAQPTDENRRVAFAKAEKADLGTAAGCRRRRAFFAGDSLAPPRRSCRASDTGDRRGRC
ncbi:MAG: hypothetical protein U0133_10955 [Gemmatimonadales bacterium]